MIIGNSELWQLIPRLAGHRVLIIGDIMLDRFVSCRMDRISPEAAVPVLRHESEMSMLGGAGNVAANIRGLDAVALLIGLIGDDNEGERIRAICREMQIEDRWLITTQHRPTPLKTRYIAKGQQVIRYDREEISPVDAGERAAIVAAFEAALSDADIVILSDYAKGTLSDGLSPFLIDHARQLRRPVVVDPKGRNYAIYRGATVIKPNLKELAEATGQTELDDATLVAAAARLATDLEVDAIVASRGPAGISVVGAERAVHIPTVAREVYDEAGAGDTVVAALALGLAAGFDVETAARLANAAAGVVVAKHGTAQVSQAELIHVLSEERRQTGNSAGGLVPIDLIEPLVRSWRADGNRIGFTNGCFDILHAGHVTLLEEAKRHCDRLVVGLNSDASVRRLKGPARPINDEAARGRVLAALGMVDAVVVFADDTPLSLIQALLPDVLVKGADYTIENVVGAEFVLAHGGRVELVPLISGRSTSGIVASIRQAPATRSRRTAIPRG